MTTADTRFLTISDDALQVVSDALFAHERNLSDSLWEERDEDDFPGLATQDGYAAALADARQAVTAVTETAVGTEHDARRRLNVDPAALQELRTAARAARAAADGDSNDDEIESLQDALEQALRIIGLDDDRPEDPEYMSDEDREALDREIVVTSVITLDTSDPERIAAFRAQAIPATRSSILADFGKDSPDLMGYEGALVVGQPQVIVSGR